MTVKLMVAAISAALMLSAGAYAADNEFTITEKDKKFSPAELVVPAGQKIKLTIKNEDSTPAEFESHVLHREKVVGANSQIVLYVGPLTAGTYSYLDDFHHESTGKIIAK